MSESCETQPTDPRNPATGGAVIESDRNSDPVEAALAEALRRAAEAGEWGVVAQLARELESRREAHRAPNVVDLEQRRKRR